MKPVENFRLPISDYYFHITANDLGESVKLTPKIPSVFKDAEDYTTPRICVSDSVLGCFIGIGQGNEFTVYCIPKNEIKKNDVITNEKIIKDKLVWDAHISREAWLLKPTVLNKVGQIAVIEKDKIAIEFTPLTIAKGMYNWNNYNQSRNVIYTEIFSYYWTEGYDPSNPKQIVFSITRYVENLK